MKHIDAMRNGSIHSDDNWLCYQCFYDPEPWKKEE